MDTARSSPLAAAARRRPALTPVGGWRAGGGAGGVGVWWFFFWGVCVCVGWVLWLCLFCEAAAAGSTLRT